MAVKRVSMHWRRAHRHVHSLFIALLLAAMGERSSPVHLGECALETTDCSRMNGIINGAVGITYLTLYPHCMETNSTLLFFVSNVYFYYSVKCKLIITYTGTINYCITVPECCDYKLQWNTFLCKSFVSRIDNSILSHWKPIVNVRGELPIWHNFGNLSGVFSPYCIESGLVAATNLKTWGN